MKSISLEELLKKHYQCKKPVLKSPETCIDFDGFESKRHLSKAGIRAYEQLISLIYDLDEITGYNYGLDSIIEELDNIAEGRECNLKELK